MDIEGAEFSVLQGAVDTLDKTVGMTLEVDVFYGPASRGNFLDIYSFLAARNFSLLDISNLGYRPSDHVLYQVHASFLNKKYEFRHAANFFSDGGQEGRMGEEMRQRRDAILARNEHLLRYL